MSGRRLLACVLAASGAGCESHDCTNVNPPDPTLVDPGPKSAVVERDVGSRDVWAISDVHGGYDRLVALLANNGLIDGVPASPELVRWSGGDAVLLVLGDMIDKGPEPIEVIDLFRALEPSAVATSGEVIVLLGNHEAEFLVDAHNSKATSSDGFDAEVCNDGLDPGAIAAGLEKHGAWLREKPLGARVGGWFFAHAGNTKGRGVADLDGALRAAIAAHPDYDDPEIVGGDSILESRDWYSSPGVTTASAAALGVGHVVFGHTPSALGAAGSIATGQDGMLFRIDCGMSPDVDDSEGCLLRIHRVDATTEVAEAFDAHGASAELWRGAPAR